MSHSRSAPTTDALVALLADRRRRTVVRHLAERPAESSLETLVETLSPANADPADERELRTALHHNHLPRLDEAGLVEYDAATHAVRYRPDDRAESLLRFLAEAFDD
ncbi:DUF7344 domain-containing protein [Candidatus Halobonum tyrrellensis]|uniref:DUF7344 domain-containing protein n=1 Tax=Candidatus Halobonum tyrrellensis G22 TaxID=1324957 RepID=V4J4A1_9EURY|nr:hypothetical protein [Candidatus Halobonum tyrrellensis]ESP90197.1 hypothetical protein K933_00010 [Candidatus Halobonum tyrrellensis G22]